MEVRYKRNKKNARAGEQMQRLIEDLEDEGIEFIELKWIKYPFISIYTQMCGFETYQVQRTQTGVLKKLVRDSRALFLADDRGQPGKGNGVGYAYIPKTERNMKILAASYANKIAKVTDRRVEEEILEIIEECGFPKKLDLRNKAADRILAVKREEERALARRDKLKRQIEIKEAENEADELERRLAELNGEAVEEETAEVVDEEVLEEAPASDAEEKGSVQAVAEPATQTPKPKRTINTKNIKRK